MTDRLPFRELPASAQNHLGDFADGSLSHKILRVIMRRKKRFDLSAQELLSGTRLVDKRLPLIRLAFQSRFKNLDDLLPVAARHY